ILLLTENMPFRAIIHHCGLLFHYGSTTMLEAYLAQVSSVYVNSGKLRLGSDKLYEFNDLGIPSTLSVDVVDVPSIVSQHAAAPIKLKRQREVEQYLEDILELKIGCDYRASNRIADFLLSIAEEEPQHISSDDKYLAQIIHQSGPALIDMLFNKGLSKAEVNDFKGALFYFDKALLVAETGRFQVKKLQYLRSYCLYKMGLIDEAASAIQQELAVNPDDSQVQKLHRQLQSALRGKTTMVVPHTRKKDYNCSPTMITTDSYGLSNNIEQQTSENACYGRRLIPHYDVSDGQKGLERARKSFKNGNFNEAFDIYEQLSIAYPAASIEILAEVYDQYQCLPNRDRYSLYQSRIFNFGINPTDKVLDIGSGNIPFQLATHLADIAINDNYYGRAGVPFKYLDGKSVFECNIENMPFGDKEFDFVCCSHVLEHVHNPQKACDELMRIGKRGYIETPTRAKDLWLNNAKVSNYRWSVERAYDRLIFTEYAKDQIEGLGSDILSSMHCAPQSIREKAFSALIYLKAHLFNTMLLWEDSFKYEVRTPDHSQTNVSEDVPVIVEG
ncbi:MAG: class I SAM-dependent methyltransferase, partial [Planctomycetota bacterium]